MKSQTVVPCGIKFYGSLQNYLDKKFTDFNFMDPQSRVARPRFPFGIVVAESHHKDKWKKVAWQRETTSFVLNVVTI